MVLPVPQSLPQLFLSPCIFIVPLTTLIVKPYFQKIAFFILGGQDASGNFLHKAKKAENSNARLIN